MPKMKTKKAAAKRYRQTASGKLKFGKSFRRHILEKKAPKRKKQARKACFVHESDLPRLKRCLPYGLK